MCRAARLLRGWARERQAGGGARLAGAPRAPGFQHRTALLPSSAPAPLPQIGLVDRALGPGGHYGFRAYTEVEAVQLLKAGALRLPGLRRICLGQLLREVPLVLQIPGLVRACWPAPAGWRPAGCCWLLAAAMLLAARRLLLAAAAAACRRAWHPRCSPPDLTPPLPPPPRHSPTAHPA